MTNKTIRVIVQGGVVVDVENIPDGYEVQIVDKDENKWSIKNYRGLAVEAIENAGLVDRFTCQGM